MRWAFRLIGLVIVALGVGGCASGEISPLTADRPMPPMPTMGPPRTTAPPPVEENEIFAAAMKSALAQDIPSTLKVLGLLTEPSERSRVTTKLISTLAGQNLSIAAQVARALPPGVTRATAIEAVALAWTQRDESQALQWALAMDTSDATAARRVVARALVQTDARAALDRVRALPQSAARDEMVGAVAAAWARRDPESAVSWLGSEPNAALRERLTATMAFEIAQSSPTRAIQLAETLPPGRDRWLIFVAIGQTWAAVDQDAAFTWANRLPSGEAREALFDGINTGTGAAGTRRTMTMQAPLGGSRNRGVRASYATGLAMDPPSFTAWLEGQPQTMSRNEAIIEFIKQRAAIEPGSIGTWIAELKGEPSRRMALDIYFEEVLRASPAAAADWLRSLPNSDRNIEMLEKTAREWTLTDPQAAARWAREMNLPFAR